MTLTLHQRGERKRRNDGTKTRQRKSGATKRTRTLERQKGQE